MFNSGSALSGSSSPHPPVRPIFPDDLDTSVNDDELEGFGEEIAYDDDLESALLAAESQTRPLYIESEDQIRQSFEIVEDVDMDDLVHRSPFEEFRKKGWLSVSDLIGTVWCEVQVS